MRRRGCKGAISQRLEGKFVSESVARFSSASVTADGEAGQIHPEQCKPQPLFFFLHVVVIRVQSDEYENRVAPLRLFCINLASIGWARELCDSRAWWCRSRGIGFPVRCSTQTLIVATVATTLSAEHVAHRAMVMIQILSLQLILSLRVT
ncbi:hypothetical protein NDU88_005628 [Pleurodeles waltl]|uniref:Uncharacterized protein n=1 Tax=Pleurodeles waltl TaxID=8319 RepID=A0AAV7W8L4_PLEWA|nr:hypothetical protein NDU88_005628 [Pleurodeles waltl]